MARGRHPHNFARAGGQAVAAAMLAAQGSAKIGLNLYEAEARGETEARRVMKQVKPVDWDDNVVAYENRCLAAASWPGNWEQETEAAFLRGFLREIRKP